MSSAPLGRWRAKNILVLDLEEVAGGKLAALLSRSATRDLFDVRSILEMKGLDETNIRAMFLVSAAASWADARKASIDVDALEDPVARHNLVECLPRDFFDGYGGGPDGWFDESIEMCREYCAPYTTHSVAERGFLDGVQRHAEVRTGLLTAPPGVLARIATYQWLAFKCQKVLRQRESAPEPPHPTRPRPRGPSRGL